jgi:hypothetical protein
MFGGLVRQGQSIVPEVESVRVAPVLKDTQLRRAYGYLELYAICHSGFLTEDVRAMAEHDGFELGSDKRAWGPVMQRGVDLGIITPMGAGKAKSSRGSLKIKWRSLIIVLEGKECE